MSFFRQKLAEAIHKVEEHTDQNVFNEKKRKKKKIKERSNVHS